MSSPARMPSGAPTAGRPTRRDAQRPRDGMVRIGPAVGTSAATRCWRTAPVIACLVTGALAPLVPAPDAHAQSRIGRLFSSPEQRVELDRLRDDTSPGEVPEPVPVPGPAGRVSRPEPERGSTAFAVTLDGVVMRSDGHRVTWVNGVEIVAGGSTPAGVRVETDAVPGGGFRIRVSREGTSAILVPGQSVDRSGRVRDVYERQATAVLTETPDEDATLPAREIPSAAAFVEPPRSDPRLLPASRGQEPARMTQTLAAPSAEGIPSARKSRDEQPAAARMTGRGSAGL